MPEKVNIAEFEKLPKKAFGRTGGRTKKLLDTMKVGYAYTTKELGDILGIGNDKYVSKKVWVALRTPMKNGTVILRNGKYARKK